MDMWDEFSFLEDADKLDNWSLENWCETHGERGMLIAKEWNRERNLDALGQPLNISDVSANRTRKKYWWKCTGCGNDFQMAINMRTQQGQGCKKCGKKNGGKKNRQNAMKDGNDLLTWCNSHGNFGSTLSMEWDTDKNMELHGISIAEISQKSSLEVNWICSRCGHPYIKKVYARVALGVGCPACCRIGTSFPEQVICRSISQVFTDTLSRTRLFDNIEYDIYIPSENVAIEYNGSYWHREKETRDKMKRDLCLRHGVRFISINAYNGSIDMKFEGDEIKYNISTSNHKGQLNKIVDYILNLLGHSGEEINFEKAIDESYGQMLGYIDDNFTKYEPRLILEWDKALNKNIEPEYFSKSSHQRIKWRCKRCGFVFENSINSRIRFQSGCANCGYNIFDDKIHLHGCNRRKIVTFGLNNL
ncbi:MAG: zinc-ribbon domain-containing protein [Lachnospiraceae bacterium]|nr:zinc-ribbon domain-containing protein [Lachnospiraceae bacterium]